MRICQHLFQYGDVHVSENANAIWIWPWLGLLRTWGRIFVS